MTNFLNEQNFQNKFELLSVDLEGDDLTALKELDLKSYQPQNICIENWNSKDDVLGILNSEIHQYLSDQSYELVAFSGLSTIYQRSIA